MQMFFGSMHVLNKKIMSHVYYCKYTKIIESRKYILYHICAIIFFLYSKYVNFLHFRN